MSKTSPAPGERPKFGLSLKLITMIVVTILGVEVLIYLPSVANFRASWLDDRVRVGGVAARVIDVVPEDMNVPAELADALLRSADAVALVIRREGRSELIERPDVLMPKADVTADMRERNPLMLIGAAIDTLAFGGDRIVRIIGNPPGSTDTVIELLMSDAALRDDMLVNSRNIFILSLLVAAFTSLAIYIFLDRLLVRPFGRITANMIAFRDTPENASRIIAPSKRRDEIGIAERELAALETDLFEMLHQRKHLADLGLAVAKINHDLRNTLGAAQLLSDQVATLDDPKVQRLAPRLLQTLDRAIGFAQSVLDYGRQSTTVPKPQPVDMRALVTESAAEAALFGHPLIAFENEIPDDLILRVDPEQIGRVAVNLLKNAREAIEGAADKVVEPKISVQTMEDENWVTIEVIDNGPGLPPRARENLFRAFEGSGRAGGTGLGLVIARELVEANGGQLRYVDNGRGTVFAVDLPASRVV